MKKTILIAFLLLISDYAYTQERGDIGSICYIRKTGTFWARQKHSCEYIVLETIGSKSFKVQYREKCWHYGKDSGDTEILDNWQHGTTRCDANGKDID